MPKDAHGEREDRTRTEPDEGIHLDVPGSTVRSIKSGGKLLWAGVALLVGLGGGAGGLSVLGGRDTAASQASAATAARDAADAKQAAAGAVLKAEAASAAATEAGHEIVNLKVAVGKIETAVAAQQSAVTELTRNVNAVLRMRAGRVGRGQNGED